MDASALDEILNWMDADGYGVPIGTHERKNEAREELAALRARVEAAERDRESAAYRENELQLRVFELGRAINWALGCEGDFAARKDGQGAYYWRKELADRAGLRYDKDKERYVHDLAKHYEACRALRGENEGKVST